MDTNTTRRSFVATGICAIAVFISLGLYLMWGPTGGTSVQFTPTLAIGVMIVLAVSAAILPILLAWYAAKRVTARLGWVTWSIIAIVIVAWEALLVPVTFYLATEAGGTTRHLSGETYYERNVNLFDENYRYYEPRGALFMSRESIGTGSHRLNGSETPSGWLAHNSGD